MFPHASWSPLSEVPEAEKVFPQQDSTQSFSTCASSTALGLGFRLKPCESLLSWSALGIGDASNSESGEHALDDEDDEVFTDEKYAVSDASMNAAGATLGRPCRAKVAALTSAQLEPAMLEESSEIMQPLRRVRRLRDFYEYCDLERMTDLPGELRRIRRSHDLLDLLRSCSHESTSVPAQS